MKIFVTGATGHIGSLVVRELVGAGHEVVGLARSERSRARLEDLGADARPGSLQDLDGMAAAAASVDAVAHLAFLHGSAPTEAADADVAAIAAMGEALAGTGKALVVTSGTAGITPGRVVTEEDRPDPDQLPVPRSASELATFALAERDVRASVVRLAPSVHGPEDAHGFVPTMIDAARRHGAMVYVGDGEQRWPAVHEQDAARLFRLAVENAPAGAVLHGVGDEAIVFRAIAEAIGRSASLPVHSVSAQEAGDVLGWLAPLVGMDTPASRSTTTALLGWRPEHPGLLEDLQAVYSHRSQDF